MPQTSLSRIPLMHTKMWLEQIYFFYLCKFCNLKEEDDSFLFYLTEIFQHILQTNFFFSHEGFLDDDDDDDTSMSEYLQNKPIFSKKKLYFVVLSL